METWKLWKHAEIIINMETWKHAELWKHFGNMLNYNKENQNQSK